MGKRAADGPVRYQPRPGHCVSRSKSYIKKQTQKTETGDGNCEVSAYLVIWQRKRVQLCYTVCWDGT